MNGIAAGAQATWEAAAQAAWSTYATQYNAAAAAYNGSLAAADAGYNAVADGAAATLSAVYATANAAAQSALDSARQGWVTTEGNASAACVGAATAADAAWVASEEGAWEGYLGASGALAGHAPTATGGANANLTAAMQAGAEGATPSSENVPPVVGTTVSGTTSVITENRPDGPPWLPPGTGGEGSPRPDGNSWPSSSGDMRANTRTPAQRYRDDLYFRMRHGSVQSRAAAVNESMSGPPSPTPTGRDIQQAVEAFAAALAGARSQRGRYAGVGSVAPNKVIPDVTKRIPASEKQAVSIAKQIEKDLGKQARRQFHNMKDAALGERTSEELRMDAQALYEQFGKEIPKWLR